MLHALEAAGLTATHRRGVAALRGVSLGIGEGEAVAVVGRSGSGKTTLGRLLAGLPPPGATVGGTLRWRGGEAPVARARSRGLARRVAWMPQDGIAALHPQLRVGTQIAETLRAAGQHADAGTVAAALLDVELDAAFAARYPHELSGGQGQRVALACALSQSPAILVADEPTSALDDATGAAILRLLDARRRARRMALVLITHDIIGATAMCDRVLVLEDGLLVEDAAAGDLRRAPRSASARSLFAAANEVEIRPACCAHAA